MRTRILLGIFSLSLLFAACSKKDKPGDPEDDGNIDIETKELITLKAPTVGQLVSKSIGSGGGTFQSEDGKVTVTVPAGAVSTNTAFGIQTVEPTLSKEDGDNKLNYRLTPHNVTFAKPIVLEFSYDGTIAEVNEDVLEVAYQDEAGYWHALPTALNKSAKKLTVTKTSFSDFEFYEKYELMPASPSVRKNQSIAFLVGVLLSKKPDENEPAPGYDDLLTPLLPEFTLGNSVYQYINNRSVKAVKNWRIIAGEGSIKKRDFNSATYSSPASIPVTKTATVEVTLEGLKGPKDTTAPGGYRAMGNLILRKSIALLADEYMIVSFGGNSYTIPNPQVSVTTSSATVTGNTGSGIQVSIFYYGVKKGFFPIGKQGEPGKGFLSLVINNKVYQSLFFQCTNTSTIPVYSNGKLQLEDDIKPKGGGCERLFFGSGLYL